MSRQPLPPFEIDRSALEVRSPPYPVPAGQEETADAIGVDGEYARHPRATTTTRATRSSRPAREALPRETMPAMLRTPLHPGKEGGNLSYTRMPYTASTQPITGLTGFDTSFVVRTCDRSCSDSLNGATNRIANEQFALAA